MVNELVSLPMRVLEGGYNLIMKGTTEKINFSFTLLGRKIGADTTLYLAETRGQEGKTPAPPPQPPAATP